MWQLTRQVTICTGISTADSLAAAADTTNSSTIALLRLPASVLLSQLQISIVYVKKSAYQLVHSAHPLLLKHQLLHFFACWRSSNKHSC
jgi:hypothetical protein